MTNEESHERIMVRLLDGAAERGLCGAQWRESWWWQDRERMAAAHRVLGLKDELMCVPIAGGGTALITPHVVTGWLMVFAVCADGSPAGPETTSMSVDRMAELSKADKTAWLSWWWAMREQRKAEGARKKAPLKVGDWVGGITKTGAVLGMVATLGKDGEPSQIQAGDFVFRSPEGARWFAWLGPVRQAAAKALAFDGEASFPSYLSMRASVAFRGRQLIRSGQVSQEEDDKPLKTGGRRRRGQ